MYLRHTTVRKNGKTHTYWTLVRSVRLGRRVHQETVAHLGELDEEDRKVASALARHFMGERADQLACGDSRRLPFGIGGFRREHDRRDDGRRDR